MDVKEATKMHSKDYVSNSSSEQGKSPGKILLQSSWEPLLLLLPFHVSLEQRTKQMQPLLREQPAALQGTVSVPQRSTLVS